MLNLFNERKFSSQSKIEGVIPIVLVVAVVTVYTALTDSQSDEVKSSEIQSHAIQADSPIVAPVNTYTFEV